VKTFLGLAIAGSICILCGCGGGGASSGGSGGGSEVATGPIVSRSLTGGNTISVSGNAAFVAGLYGDTFDLVRFQQSPIGLLNPNEANSSTVIAYDESGVPKLYDFGRGFAITPDILQPPYANSTLPDLSPTYDRFLWCPYNATTRTISSVSTDGLTSTVLTSGTNDFNPQYSPDGKKFAFQTTTGIFVESISGGPATQIVTENSVNCYAWYPDGSKLIYGTGGGLIKTVPATGGTPVAIYSGSQSVYSIAFRTTRQWVAVCNNRNFVVGQGESWLYGGLMTTQAYSISFSPDGQYMVLQQGGVVVKKALQFDAAPYLTLSSVNSATPSWAPYMEKRTLVGTGGAYSTTCAGFLYGLSRNSLASFLTVESPVPSSVSFVKGDVSQSYPSNLGVTILAPDGLSALKFQNRLYGTKNAPVTATSGAKGAIVVFDANVGEISFVLPFSSTTGPVARAGARGTYRGDFLGVWDGHGKNLAPSGAHEVVVGPDGKSIHFQ
jgi:WD40-like Beta Propeller Repeat